MICKTCDGSGLELPMLPANDPANGPCGPCKGTGEIDIELLTSVTIDALSELVLFRTDEDEEGEALDVHCIVHTVRLHNTRLQQCKERIKGILAQLPDNFQAEKGGGWSFLNMGETNQGVQWTGFHWQMEMLCALAIGTKQGLFVFERDLWSALPGGMPYFVVKDIT